MSKTIDLGSKQPDYSEAAMPTPTGGKRKMKTTYPEISIPGTDCADCPKTGTATFNYKIVGSKSADANFGDGKDKVDLQITSITFPDGGGDDGDGDEEAEKPSEGMTEDFLKGAMQKAAAGGDEDEGDEQGGGDDEAQE